MKTEVEVRFIAEGSEGTRVELEHRLLENYGEQAEMMKSIFPIRVPPPAFKSTLTSPYYFVWLAN